MSLYESHPALHPSWTWHHTSPDHFVPAGWEEFEYGLCPCGEAVAWDPETEKWKPDRSLRVLVFHPNDNYIQFDDLDHEIRRQWVLQDEAQEMAEEQRRQDAEMEEEYRRQMQAEYDLHNPELDDVQAREY